MAGTNMVSAIPVSVNKNISWDKETLGMFSCKDAKSGGGEQFLLPKPGGAARTAAVAAAPARSEIIYFVMT